MVAWKGRAGQGFWELGAAVRARLEAWAAGLAEGQARVCRVRLGQLQPVRLALARALHPGQDGAPPPPVRGSAARGAAPRPARSWAGDVVMEKLRCCRSPAA